MECFCFFERVHCALLHDFVRGLTWSVFFDHGEEYFFVEKEFVGHFEVLSYCVGIDDQFFD